MPLKLLMVDLEKPENFVAVAAFDVGFAAKSGPRRAPKLPQLILLKFKRDCVSFVKVCSQKVSPHCLRRLAAND